MSDKPSVPRGPSDPSDPSGPRGPRDPGDPGDVRDVREPGDNREPRATLESRDPRDERIAELARELYRRPPDVPRDDLWTRIAEDRQHAREPVVSRATHVAPSRAWRGMWWWGGLGLAAGAAAAAAIAIWIATPRDRTSDSDLGARAPFASGSSSGTPSGSLSRSTSERAATGEPAAREPRGTPDVPGASGVPGSSGVPNPSGVPGAPEARDLDARYQLATASHLTRIDALLTAFRQDSADPEAQRAVTRWARDLLRQTRLLLDSPAGRDAELRPLLLEIELLLAEIVQLEVDEREERDRVRSNADERSLLMRIRFETPVGSVSVGL